MHLTIKQIIIGLILFAATALATADCHRTNTFGPIICKNSILAKLTTSGPAILYNCTVREHTRIKGWLLSNHSQLYNLSAKNRITLINSSIYSDSHLMGSIQAKNTAFQGTINATSLIITLENCKTQGINLYSTNARLSMVPKVYLIDHTRINGNIIFKNIPGQVIVDPTSKIAGKVKNGTLIHV